MWQQRVEKVSGLDSLSGGHTWEKPQVVLCSEAGGQGHARRPRAQLEPTEGPRPLCPGWVLI